MNVYPPIHEIPGVCSVCDAWRAAADPGPPTPIEQIAAETETYFAGREES